VYQGAEGAGILKTSDGGATWKVRGGNIDEGGSLVRTVAVDPLNHSTVYVGGLFDHAIAKSTDGGLSWNFQTSADLLNPSDIEVSPVDSDVVWATDQGQGVWRTTDGGSHWNKRISGMTSTFISSIALSPTGTSVAYAGDYNGGGVFKTSNGGSSWSPKSNGITDLHVNALAVDPDDAKHVLAGTVSGVFETTNGGTSWAPKNSGLVNGTYVFSLAFDPSDSQHVYVGLFSGGVFRSTNGSDTWSDFNTGLPVDLSREIEDLAVAGDGSAVYAATPLGVYRRST
jgi:photosystem II stability/assembly factor-like uncharacterized protein